VKSRRLGPAIGDADLDQDIGRRRFRIFDKHVKVPVVIEDAGVDQLVFRLVPAALPARFDQIVVRIGIVRIFVDTMTNAVKSRPLVKRLDEVDEAVKDEPPTFRCYDQTDNTTCQQMRSAWAPGGGQYTTMDYVDKKHVRCFALTQKYRVCGNDDFVKAEIFNGSAFAEAPKDDPRCNAWGDFLTAEYLACEAELPPSKQ
jgi:hypothetical protein